MDLLFHRAPDNFYRLTSAPLCLRTFSGTVESCSVPAHSGPEVQGTSTPRSSSQQVMNRSCCINIQGAPLLLGWGNSEAGVSHCFWEILNFSCPQWSLTYKHTLYWLSSLPCTLPHPQPMFPGIISQMHYLLSTPCLRVAAEELETKLHSVPYAFRHEASEGLYTLSCGG